jgi:two-component system, OmpR family, response regulator
MTVPNLTKILCIEDEPDIRAIAKLSLEMVGGMTVETCDSGRDALSQVAAIAPDLILLDVMMPGMDGPTTLSALRELPEARHIPIVFMTAKVQSSEVERYTQMGAIGVISKPFDPMGLATTVKDLWAKHHARS